MKLVPYVVGFAIAILPAGMPVMPGRIPGDRLIANLSEKLLDSPKDEHLYYLLGRAHYATYSNTVENAWRKKGEVQIIGSEDDFRGFYLIGSHVSPWDQVSVITDSKENRTHIKEAIRCLDTSLVLVRQKYDKLPPSNGTALTHLTLACTFESGAQLAPKINLSPPYANMKTAGQWRAKAASEYLIAFEQSISEDSKIKYEPLFGFGELISYESGVSYLRLEPKGKKAPLVRKALDKLKKLPNSGMITPIILDLSVAKPLHELLDTSSQIAFDLDGTARPQAYKWVKPTTAFLVWDPMHEGKITSGRQLFGNATWWMLWENGYAALDALDNNRDGLLSGKELPGLALWFDLNGNGKSEPGEVIPIEKTPISALRTSSDGQVGESLVSRNGVQLKSGQWLPTYDWFVSPEKSQAR